MNEMNPAKTVQDPDHRETAKTSKKNGKRDWKTPAMEEVSEQVMAQPYIRFT